MNEEIETAIRKIRSSIEVWEIANINDNIYSEKTQLAKDLEFQMTMLKLLIGVDKFSELNYFSRILKQVSEYLDSTQHKKGDK